MDRTPFIMSRCLFDKPIWQNVLQFRLFFYLVAHAVYNPQGVKVGEILVKRGQVLKSYRTLQNELAYKENNAIKTYSLAALKRAVACLCTAQRLTVNITELGTLFTIVNYEQYQDLTQYKKKGTRNGAWNSSGTAAEQQRNNNIKEIKEINKDIKTLAQNAFEKFWKAYPKKRSKGQAEKAWEKIKPDEQLYMQILDSLDKAKQSHDWQKEAGKYIPYPATWLNAKGWEDEYQEPKADEWEAWGNDETRD